MVMARYMKKNIRRLSTSFRTIPSNWLQSSRASVGEAVELASGVVKPVELDSDVGEVALMVADVVASVGVLKSVELVRKLNWLGSKRTELQRQ